MAENDPITIPVGEWLPDLPDLSNPGSINVRNVYARTPESYGPIGSGVVYSGALDQRCQGAAAFFDMAGNVHLFAGTADKLYHLVAGSTAWVDVSKVGGYTCPAEAMWQFQYANGSVEASQIGDPIQTFQLGVSAKFADLAAAAPKATYLAWIKNFLMAGSTNDPTDGFQNARLWWPALNDPTNWPTPGTQAAAQYQSSFNDLLGDYGPLMGIVGDLGNADGAAFFLKRVFRIVYSGPPNVFDFPSAEGSPGCVAPGSIVTNNNIAYYLGPDDFYSFDGASSNSISAEKWGKTFYADLDANHMDRIVGTVDPINKQIIWSYPGQGNNNGNPNRAIFYSYNLNRATIVDMNCQLMARMLTTGYTLDELYTELGYTLDNLPAPLDSRVWSGGAILLGMFDLNNKLNFLTGPNLAPLIDTTEAEPFPGRRFKTNSARPIVDGGVPSIAIGRRDTQQASVVFTAASQMNSLGLCMIRTSGRYGRGRITLPAGSIFQHIQGMELDGVKTGSR